MRARPGDLVSVVVHREDKVIGYFAELLWFDADGKVRGELWDGDRIRRGEAYTVLRDEAVRYNLILFPTLAEGGALEVSVTAGQEECRETIAVNGPRSWNIFLT